VKGCDGGYCVAGTRIALDSIILLFKGGESPENESTLLPDGCPLIRVQGAVALYLENNRDGRGVPWAELRTTQTVLPEGLPARLREATEHAARRAV